MFKRCDLGYIGGSHLRSGGSRAKFGGLRGQVLSTLDQKKAAGGGKVLKRCYLGYVEVSDRRSGGPG